MRLVLGFGSPTAHTYLLTAIIDTSDLGKSIEMYLSALGT